MHCSSRNASGAVGTIITLQYNFLQYNFLQYNFIAKCQYNCTGMFCGAKYTHYSFTPIIKKKNHWITTTANKHPGKKLFITSLMPSDRRLATRDSAARKVPHCRVSENSHICPQTPSADLITTSFHQTCRKAMLGVGSAHSGRETAFLALCLL